MNIGTRLRNILDGCTVYDVLIGIAGVLLCCLASPYVVRQFEHLSKTGDIFWNVCWDLLIFDAGLLALILFAKIIKVVVAWCKRKC